MDREHTGILTSFVRYGIVVVVTALVVTTLRPAPVADSVAIAAGSPPVAQVLAPQLPPRPSVPDTPDADGPLNPSLVEQVLDVAEDIDSFLGARLRSICDDDPQRFQQVMRHSGRRLLGLVRLHERDPALYEAKVQELRLEHRAGRLAVEYCRAARDGQNDLAEFKMQEIRRLLQIQFGLSMKVRGDSLLRLKEQVRSIEDELSRNADHYEKWVDGRLTRLVERSAAAEDCDPSDLP